MTTTTRQTEISADTDVPLVRITREFDAPVDKVFRAHVDPDLLVRWLGSRGMEMRVDSYDCRTGGAYRYVHGVGGEEYAFHGSSTRSARRRSSFRPPPSRVSRTAWRSSASRSRTSVGAAPG